MSIVSLSEIENFIGINESYTEEPGIATTTAIQSLLDSVDQFVKTCCKKDFEETSYSKEVYYTDRFGMICLKNYPIVYVDRVAVGENDGIKIRNTNTYSTASVSVLSTGLRLIKDGTANSTVLFATYQTLADVVTAVNLISGWEAQLVSSSNGTIKSTELVERFGASAINNNWVNLGIPAEAEYEIKVFKNEGIIYIKNYNSCYPIYIDYTAGYTTATMPEDLKLGFKILFKELYDKRDQSGFGLSGYTISRIKLFYEKQDLPKEVTNILDRYRKVKV